MQVEVLEYYDMFVRSASDSFMVPAVLRVRCFVQKHRGGQSYAFPQEHHDPRQVSVPVSLRHSYLQQLLG